MKQEKKDIYELVDELYGQERLSAFTEDTAVGKYLDYLNGFLRGEGDDQLFIKRYRPIVEEERKRSHAHPFLSVVTRTQGKRPEQLSETLLSLYGQTDMDFEVLLVEHKLTDEQKEKVQKIVDRQPEELRSRIRVLPLEYGNRSTPLNYGFSHAYGEYIAVLDDDDIVLDNWVESFHRAAQKGPGTILHTYSVAQHWVVVDWDDFGTPTKALRSSSGFDTSFCRPFDLITELHANYCPPISYAIPAAVFQDCGIIFDETLDTTEDWDCLMRQAFLCGVTDLPEVTGIYRLWDNAETSQTLHGQEEWRLNRKSILKKFQEIPIVMPKGASAKVDQLFWRAEESSAAANQTNWAIPQGLILTPKLFYSKKNDFCEEQSISVGSQPASIRDFDVVMRFDGITMPVRYLRFDITEASWIMLEKLQMTVTYRDNTSRQYGMKKCRHNGYAREKKICFLKRDPQVIWRLRRQGEIQSVTLCGTVSQEISDELITSICDHSFFQRVWRGVKWIAKKILGRE